MDSKFNLMDAYDLWLHDATDLFNCEEIGLGYCYDDYLFDIGTEEE